jgi:tRNA threonylcarbamoyladenosine biosynthesis protein TsaB
VLRSPLTIEPAAAVVDSLEPDEILLGPALERLRASGSLPPAAVVPDPADDFPRAEGMLRLAIDCLERGVSHDPLTLEPIYLRRSAAEEKALANTASARTGAPG